MNKLIACGFAAVLCSANAEVMDLTQAARAAKAYTVTASSSGTYGPAKLVDGALQWSNDTWSSAPFGADKTEWVEFDFGDQYEPGKIICLESYSIYQNNANMGNSDSASRSPSDFTLEGSNDGEAWTVLDTRSGLTFSGFWKGNGTGWRNFPIRVKDIGFRRYRLVMTKPAGSSATYYSITEWKLVGRLLDSAAEVTKYRYWDGTVSDDWNDPENWTPDAEGNRTVPGDGESVVIGDRAAATVTISSSTAELESLSLGEWSLSSALTVSNWTTKVSAKEFSIGANGQVTCGAASTDISEISRVWIACSNLTLAAGAKIDVNEKGYAAIPWALNVYRYGAGPGRLVSQNGNVCGGPSHGGHGSRVFSMDYSSATPLPYDDPTDPTEPGSSGISVGWSAGGTTGGNGGGVVRIEATGRVTVNGAITANGRKATAYDKAGWGSYGDNHDSAGAGGTVNIRCRDLVGSGSLTADGGGGGKIDDIASPCMPAGGGCIAVRYDPSVQTAAAVEGMTISAAGGLCKRGCQSTVSPNPITWWSAGNVYPDDNRRMADIGTVWMTDGKLLDALLGVSLTGQVLGVSEYVREGDLAFNSGRVRFAEDGVKVSVTGNLTLGGNDSRLEIGGAVATNRSAYVDHLSTLAPTLEVGGDLTLGGVSRLDIRAAQTESAEAFGAFVKVGGTVTIATNCAVYTWSDIRTIGAPKFEVGGLTVAAGGLLSAFRRGGAGGYPKGSGLSANSRGYGPGGTTDATVGGGHGGKGGRGGTTARGGMAYDDEFRPYQAGSGGGGSYNQYTMGGFGGGLVHVSAVNGTIRVDGTVSADGEAGTLGNGFAGGGSGGTIFLEAKSFAGGENAVLTAKGGDTKPHKSVGSGSGGGGRIAVWCGEPWEATTPKGRLCRSNGLLVGLPRPECFQYASTNNFVDAGCLLGTETTGTAGDPGTCWFTYVGEAPGCQLLVR